MYVKHKLEAHDGGLWHVIVGNAFGASVAHEGGMMLVFSVGRTNFMAFSSFDESTLVRKKKEHHRKERQEPGSAANDEEHDGEDQP